MSEKTVTKPTRLFTLGIFVVLFVVEALVFAILPLSERFPIIPLLWFQAILTAGLLVTALLLRRSEKGNRYWQVTYVLFVGAMAILVSVIYSGDLLDLFGFTPDNPQGIAMAKLFESLLRVGVILALMALIKVDWGSLYLHRGRLGLGLWIGLSTFIVMVGVAFLPLASQEGMAQKLLSLAPWILIFVLANGLMEELLYRGLFLKRYEPFMGKWLANLLTAIVFTMIHMQVTYVADVLQFLFIVFPLALIWGYLMQKTDSLLASVLFHAGGDCLIIFAIFASLG